MSIVRENDKLQKNIDTKKIKKIIYVKDRLINIVL